MSHDDLLSILESKPANSGCLVSAVLNRLNDEPGVKEALRKAIEDRETDGSYRWSTPALAKLIKDKLQISIAPNTVLRHRNGCPTCSRIERS